MAKYWKRAGDIQRSDRYFTEDFRNTSRVAEQQDSEHIEGSGGCFVAGTLIRTVRGWKPIEKIKVGDGVIAYDRYGNLEPGFVKELHVHKKEQQDSDIVTLKWDGGEVRVTGNHGIYTGDEETPFVEAQTLEVGDTLLTLENNEIVQTEITDKEVKLLKYQRKDFKVYNMTITPQHTYIAAGVLVHNGGGGKSGDSRAPIEGPNTLRSRSVVRVQEILSEGEILGLVDEEQGILFDDTPIISAGGQPNFENVSYLINYGTPDQEYMPGFSEVETETAVGVEATNGNPVPRTMAPGTDAVRAKITLPAGLYTTDLNTGDINGHEVTISWQRRYPSNTGTWETVITDTVRGKATAFYQRDYRIPEPEAANGAAWDIRLTRVSADETKSTTRSTTFFDSYTEIQEIKLAYPDTAVVGIEVDAESTGGNIPVRSYDVYGIKMQVPTNYDPLARSYSGVWDGTFKIAWTDNPAWVIYDLLTNTRYGLGEYIDPDTIDKFEFYDCAVYNDELVDDGDGGTEPRYTFNAQLAQQQDSWAAIQAVASNMRASVIAGSIITLFQDRPTPVSRLVTNANVIDGLFSYGSNGLATRNTVARVSFNDPNDRYLLKTVTEEDTAAISRYGFNPIDVATLGCTSEGQARRTAKWFLETELNTPELCTFQGGLEIADLLPGEVVKIMDRDYAGVEYAGRVAGGTTTSITLDRDVTLAGGQTYTLSILNPADGVIEERTVTTGAGTTDTLTVSLAFPRSGADYVNAPWMIESDTGVVARQFRVVSKEENDKGIYTVTCAGHDPTKYARIESGINVPPPIFSDIPSQSVNPISDIIFQPQGYVDPNFGGRVRLRCNWTSPGPLVTKYSVQWRKDNNNFSDVRWVTEPTFELDPIQPGDYEVMVVAYTARGVKSVPYLETYSYAPGVNNDFAPPLNLRVSPDTQGANSSEFTTQDLTIRFDVNPANDDIGGLVFDDTGGVGNEPPGTPGTGNYVSNIFGGIAGYKIIWKDSLDNVLDEINIPATPNVDADTFSITYPYAENVASTGGPHRQVKVDIYTLSTDGGQSTTALSGTLTNPVPSAPGVTILNNPDGAFVQATPLAADRDVAGMVVAIRDTGGNFTPVLGDVIYTGADLATQIPFTSPFDSRSIRVGLYDSFDYDFNNVLFSTFEVQEAAPYGIASRTTLPTLPDPLYPPGVVIYLSTDAKLYRVDTDGLTWTAATDGSDINPSTITSDKIAVGEIKAANMDANSITVGNAALADAVVTTAKIDNLAVTTGKIGDLQVDTLKIKDAAVTNIVSASVGAYNSNTFWTGTVSGDPVVYDNIASVQLVNVSGSSEILITMSIDATVSIGGTRECFLNARLVRNGKPGNTVWTGMSDGGPSKAQIKGSFTVRETNVVGSDVWTLQLYGSTAQFLGNFYHNICTLVVTEVKK